MILLLFVLLSAGIVLVSGVAFFVWMTSQVHQAGKYRQIRRHEDFKEKYVAISTPAAQAHINKVPGFEINYKVGRAMKSVIVEADTEGEAMAKFAKLQTGYSSIVSCLKKN